MCPVCSCTFKHNWKIWAPCLIGALLSSIIFYMIIPVIAMSAAIFLIGLVAASLGPYIIVSEGRENVTEDEVKIYVPKKKESKWFIALVILLALAVLTFLILVNI